MDAPPPFVLAERDALIAEVHEAFMDVTREGGVSWSEAHIADSYGLPSVVESVRGTDPDDRWQDLLAATDFFPGTGIGYWPFLDAVGFRYYLPAAMVLTVMSGNDATVCFPLTLESGSSNAWPCDQWTLLNIRQRRCIKRFLQYMSVVEAYAWTLPSGWNTNEWGRALNLYWKDVPNEGDSREPVP